MIGSNSSIGKAFSFSAAVLAMFGAVGSLPLLAENAPGAASTMQIPSEPYRPAYHFTPRAHWMNDPNGLVYYEGVYHLFFQHNPNDTVWGPMHWGHATSRDLVHWQEKPIALAPDVHGTIFSGSAVVDRHNTSGLSRDGRPPLLAIFTYHQEEAFKAGQPSQSQGMAYSLDGGESWSKHTGNPVLRPDEGQKDFRDPKVFWHQPSHSWIMALAVGDHTEFFGSRNLKQWERLSRFGADLGAHGGVWECPDLLPLRVAETGKTKWVLIQSINPGGPNGGSATQYFVGDFDGKSFTPDPGFARAIQRTGPRWLDWGRDNYAGVTWSGMSGQNERKVLIGWMSNWDYAQKTPTVAWRSAMTLPREITLHYRPGEGYVLHSWPVRELRQLEGEAANLPARNLFGSVDVPVPSRSVSQSRIDLAFELSAGLGQVGLELTNKAGDIYRFSYDGRSKSFISDRTASGQTAFSPHFASVDKAPRFSRGRVVHMTLYIDHASVEAFLDKGAVSMTTAIFPREPYTGIRLFARDGNARLLYGRVAMMKAGA